MTIQQLKDRNLVLLECVSGSKAYGLATPESDTDIKGVFYLPKEDFYGLGYIEQVNNESNDEAYYEIGRFVELLLKNNPNMMELLATPKDLILFRHPLIDLLSVPMFLSQLCKDTFAGYANTQIKKARGYKKKAVNPMEEERKSVLDFCFIIEGASTINLKQWLDRHGYKQEQCGLTAIPHTKGVFTLFYDPTATLNYNGIMSSEQANEVSLSSVPKGEKSSTYLYFNVESYSAHCKQHREYWEWIGKRNEERYQNNRAHGQDYDAKNMMHTIRLLQMAEEIALDRQLNVVRSNREELLAIKRGEYDYDTLLDMANRLMQHIELAYATTILPPLPDHQKAKDALIHIRTALYN